MNNDHFIPDTLFPSENSWEVPSLRLDIQPKGAEIPFVRYGEQRRTYDMRGCGTLHFYTDDYKFTAIYDHPERILQHHPANIVEPNYSLFNETPAAFGLQAVYKKRWIARAMQERGIGVFVDLNVAQKFIKLNLMGIPRGFNAFATRGYSDRIHALEIEFSLARAISERDRPLFVCYGGGAKCREFCNKVGAVYVTPVIRVKTKELALKQMLDDGVIAFADEDYSLKAIEEGQRQLWLDAIADYGTDVQHQIEQ